jgi:hypothetical protein
LSGPKSSEYYLALAERKRQEEERERRLEEEKCQLLEQAIDSLKSKLQASVKQMMQKTDKCLAEAKDLVPDSFTIDKIERTVNHLMNQVDELPSDIGVRNSGNMRNYLSRHEAVFQNVTSSNEDGPLSYNLIRLEQEIKERKISNAEVQFISGSKDMKPIQRYSFNLDAPVALTEPKKETVNLDGVLMEFYSLTDSYISNCFLANKSEIQKLKKSVQQIVSNERLDEHYKVEQVQMRHKAFLATSKKYDQEIEYNQRLLTEFNNLHLTYLSLCNMLKEVPKEYKFEVNKDGFEVINKLKTEIELCRTNLTKKEESEYISRSINEVMEELGYEIVATDFLSTPKRDVIHNIYEFEQGNVINVFTSDNGSLMFEVTGVKESNDLTELEKLKIKESMENFCTKYELIKSKLNAKGIRLASENLRPADVRYAKSIDISKKKQVKPKQKNGLTKKPLASSLKNN